MTNLITAYREANPCYNIETDKEIIKEVTNLIHYTDNLTQAMIIELLDNENLCNFECIENIIGVLGLNETMTAIRNHENLTTELKEKVEELIKEIEAKYLWQVYNNGGLVKNGNCIDVKPSSDYNDLIHLCIELQQYTNDKG